MENLEQIINLERETSFNVGDKVLIDDKSSEHDGRTGKIYKIIEKSGVKIACVDIDGYSQHWEGSFVKIKLDYLSSGN